MSGNTAKYNDVKFSVFAGVSDRVREDHKLRAHVTLYYNGTNLYGDVTINGSGGYSDEYKKVLAIFLEEYSK